MASKKMATLCVNSDSVTLIVQDNKYDNNFIYKTTLPFEGYMNGEFTDVESLYNAVKNLVDECRAVAFCDPKQILVGVPGAFTTVVNKMVTLDFGTVRKVTEKDIDALCDIGNTYADSSSYKTISASPIYYTAEKHNNTMNPLIITSDKIKCYMSYSLCETKFIDCFDELGKLIGIEFEYHSAIMAQAMYVVEQDFRDDGVVMVDVGFTSTTVAFLKGDGILHQTSFSLGGGTIAADLYLKQDIIFAHANALVNKVNLNLNPSDEETYFVDVGGKKKHYNIKDTNMFIANRVENIANHIVKALEISKEEIDKNAVLLLTGSGISNMAGAKEIISDICNREVAVIAANMPILDKPKDSCMAGLVLFQQRRVASSKGSLIAKIKNVFNKLRS